MELHLYNQWSAPFSKLKEVPNSHVEHSCNCVNLQNRLQENVSKNSFEPNLPTNFLFLRKMLGHYVSLAEAWLNRTRDHRFKCAQYVL
jgi:hypothetical protein